MYEVLRPYMDIAIANAQQMYSSFAEAPAQSFTVGSGLEELAPAQTAKAMLGALEKAVRDALAGNEVG